MDDLQKRAADLEAALKAAFLKLGLEAAIQERSQLQAQMQAPDFWQDNQNAAAITKNEAALSARISPWLELQAGLADIKELLAMQDASLSAEMEEQLSQLEANYLKLKKNLNFQGPYDERNVILSIYAGAGGTDAQDWAAMLLRMYVRWAEASKLKVTTVDESKGEEAGIKSATLEISGGSYLYGRLKGEHGVHRLVRKSPFNSAGSRETSFARVEILPAIDTPEEVEIDDKDLRVDVYRAGGHGGQSVNTTDSAVRLTHIPTGISVAIQNERSQLQNKETALTILRSRLAALQLEQHAQKIENLKGPDKANEWGSQIRNYILDDRIVKDLRSGWQSHTPDRVLDGDLDPLIEAGLEQH